MEEQAMSGHSKWHSIKHKKAREDAKRGKVFTKMIREITVAARAGGGDPSGNPRLRTAILAAKAVNMPADNIDRAIKKGTGELEGVNYEEITYEGYGPGGVAILVEVLTDNRNRTAADIRRIFTRGNGNLGESGCVSWIFEKKGLITFDKASFEEDLLMESVLESGAEDMDDSDDSSFEVYTSPGDFVQVKEYFDNKGIAYNLSQITMIPQNSVRLEGKEAEQTLRLIETLEDQDDVQNVYANFDIPQEVMEKIESS